MVINKKNPLSRTYGMGTWLNISYSGFYRGGRVLCSDGKLRNLKWISKVADTFFSVPAAVMVKGKQVSGYVTVETINEYSAKSDNNPTVVKFAAYNHRKNGRLLPEGKFTEEQSSEVSGA
jgi:hypothetical protein